MNRFLSIRTAAGTAALALLSPAVAQDRRLPSSPASIATGKHPRRSKRCRGRRKGPRSIFRISPNALSPRTLGLPGEDDGRVSIDRSSSSGEPVWRT